MAELELYLASARDGHAGGDAGCSALKSGNGQPDAEVAKVSQRTQKELPRFLFAVTPAPDSNALTRDAN
jgi:hypothetical protein